MPSIHLLITGRVQGVGFREWSVRTARGLALAGWVRNRADGAVEIGAGGAEDKLTAFRAACQSGPRFAEVGGVADLEATDDLPFPFERRPTV